MLRVILFQKAYNPGYTYLRNGKIVRVEAFSDRRVKRATAAGKRDDRTGDLFGDAGPTIDKPLKELIDDHEKVIDALESPSKATRQAAADEQKEHLEAYREQLDTAVKVRLIEGSMDEFGGYEVGGKRYTGEDAEMLVDEAREIAFATGKRIEDALLQIVPAEHLEGRQADPAAELRSLWDKQGVPKEKQDALIALIAGKAAPGAKVWPFEVAPPGDAASTDADLAAGWAEMPEKSRRAAIVSASPKMTQMNGQPSSAARRLAAAGDWARLPDDIKSRVTLDIRLHLRAKARASAEKPKASAPAQAAERPKRLEPTGHKAEHEIGGVQMSARRIATPRPHWVAVIDETGREITSRPAATRAELWDKLKYDFRAVGEDRWRESLGMAAAAANSDDHPAPMPRSLLSAIPDGRREEWKDLHRQQHELHHYELGQVREKLERTRSRRNKALSDLRIAEAGLASLRSAPIADPTREGEARKHVDKAHADYDKAAQELDRLSGLHQTLYEKVARLGRAKDKIYPGSGDMDLDFASMKRRAPGEQAQHEKDMLKRYRLHYKMLDASRKREPLAKSFPRVLSVRQVARMS